MAFKCKIGLHSWNGCKCSECEKTRDEQHDWSKDCEKCSKCGKKRENQHNWSKEFVKCSKCGKTRENVIFQRDEKLSHPSAPNIMVTKKILSAVNKDAAIEYLSKQKVTERFFYIEIDTPNGRFGIDIEGKIYDSKGNFIEVDKNVIKTNENNFAIIDFKSDHPIIVHSIVLDNGKEINIEHLKNAKITGYKEKLYIEISWNRTDDPNLEENKGYDQKGAGIRFIYTIIFINNTLDNRKFQCNAIIAMTASSSEREYTFSIIDKIIEVF